MEFAKNEGYIITDKIHIGNDEFVLGVHESQPNMFVTWKYNPKEDNYYWGHYHSDLYKAQKDLVNRAAAAARMRDSLMREEAR